LFVPDWFTEKLPDFNAWLNSEVSRLDLPSLKIAPAFVVAPEMLEVDGVHLTPSSGDLFLKQLCADILSLLPSDTDDVTLVDEFMLVASSPSSSDSEPADGEGDDRIASILKIVKSNSKKLGSVKRLKDNVATLSSRSVAFETQVRLRRQRDNLVFARIKEESDGELNRSREDRVVISGLERASVGLTTHQEKKAHYTTVVTELVLKACPELDPKPAINDVIVNLRRDLGNPTIEVKFDSVANAFAFRKSAAALAKAQNDDFARLFFSNSITQATRVRIEVMKAIAKKLTTLTENAYVQGFISRPVLRYVSRDPAASLCAGTGRSYSFVDSVSRFGDLVHGYELSSAYKRAGTTFKGAMEQYFVVLREAEDVPVASGSNQFPVGVRGRVRGVQGFRGRKRIGESPPGTPSRKKPSV
jgi:uncharacterized protein YqgV (UPF0045/DUF77 family)